MGAEETTNYIDEELANSAIYYLSPENKEHIDRAVETIRSAEHSSDQEDISRMHDAEQTILNLGPKVLYYLKNKLSSNPHEKYLFTLFMNNLATGLDLDLLLQTARDPAIYNNLDASAASNISETLARIIYEIRTDYGHTQNLDIIASTLIPILNSPSIPSTVRYSYLTALAATGTETASEYIHHLTNLGTSRINQLRIYLSSHEDPYPLTHRYIFPPQQQAPENSPQDTYSNGYQIAALDETDEPDQYDPDEDDENEGEPERISEDAIGAVDIVNGFLKGMVHTKTVKPALYLHVYNLLKQNPEADAEAVFARLKHVQKLIDEELKISTNKELPTIGVEVEVPYKTFPFESKIDFKQLRMDLENMGIIVKREGTDRLPTEIEFPPTYSAKTQNRIIYELRRLQLIPIDKTFASMHINIGSRDKEYPGVRLSFESTARPISDLLTYAFIPAGRVASRGHSRYAWKLKTGFDVDNGGIYENKWNRIEFRTPRIIGKNTYRLLQETQNLGVLMFSDKADIAKLRQQFKKDVLSLLAEYNLKPNLPENNQQKAAEVLKDQYQKKLKGEKNLIDDARRLMTEYSQRVYQLLNPVVSPAQ